MALWPPFTVLIWRRAEQTHLKGYFCLHISKEGKLNVSRKIAIFKSWLPQPIMWAKQKHPPLTLIRFKREGSRRKFANCQKADTQIPTAQGDKKRGFSDFAHPKLPSPPLSRLAGVCTNAGSCWEAKSFLQSFWSPLVTTTHTCRSAHPWDYHFKLLPKLGGRGSLHHLYLNFSLLRESITEELQISSYRSQAAGKIKYIQICTVVQVRIKMADSTWQLSLTILQ